VKTLKGYIFSRPFFGERAPQHVQNIVLRDYCKKNNFNFLLSGTEYKVENSTYILNELLKNIRSYNGIIFYSLLQLPSNLKKRLNFYKQIILKKKELHFAVENIASQNKKDFNELEKIFLIKTKNFKIKKNSSIKLGRLRNFFNPYHNKTTRNFLGRMNDDKVKCMIRAKKYDFDYWDGKRRFGYGGYKYIPNYYTKLAKNLIKTYSLNENSRILDLGCGKGFLIYELWKLLKKNKNILGCDRSIYAIKNAKKEIQKNIFYHDLKNKLSFPDKCFDLVFSINTLHNLKLNFLERSIEEINRLTRSSYICVESYRNESEQFNLQCWALTAETIVDKDTWLHILKKKNYQGDYEFIYFR
jgi:sporadic carbohydrate cluster protein (TIGR04323 family)